MALLTYSQKTSMELLMWDMYFPRKAQKKKKNQHGNPSNTCINLENGCSDFNK